MGMYNKEVIIVTSSYKEKYYFNDKFKKLPEQVKKELIIISVKYTKENGGIFTIGFYEDGSIYLETTCEENDFFYDEIGSRLTINKLKKDQADLFKALSMWYKVVYSNNK